jgi:hypothetical protein
VHTSTKNSSGGASTPHGPQLHTVKTTTAALTFQPAYFDKSLSKMPECSSVQY